MSRVQNTSDLIQEIREQADEFNVKAKSDDAIVRILNRGLRYITSELARQWPALLTARQEYSAADYNPETGYDYPTDCFEQRLVFVQIETPSAPTPIPSRSFTEVSGIDIRTTRSTIPQAWYQRGTKWFFAPAPSGGYNPIVDYVRIPDPIVRNIGRINTVNTGSDYVIVSDIDTSLISTAVDDLKSFVNVIDGMTGLIKATRQIQTIVGGKVSFRASPTQTEVDGRTVGTTLEDLDISLGDYLCPVAGTCVLQLGQAFATYMVQYAVAEIGRSLGDTLAQLSKQVADRAEEAARQQRAGRPIYYRVKNRSGAWGTIRTSVFPFIRP